MGKAPIALTTDRKKDLFWNQEETGITGSAALEGMLWMRVFRAAEPEEG